MLSEEQGARTFMRASSGNSEEEIYIYDADQVPASVGFRLPAHSPENLGPV